MNEREEFEAWHKAQDISACLLWEAWKGASKSRAKRLQELQSIVNELDKTADGVPITPKTELWQATGRGAWPCGPGFEYQRISSFPVYSTEEAAIAARSEYQKTLTQEKT